MRLHVHLEGVPELMKALTDLGNRSSTAMKKAMYNEGTALLNDSLAEVPRDTSVLAGSGTVQAVEGSNTIEVTVGYGGAASAYALVTHENPRSGKTGGLSPSGRRYKHWASVGKWKYLEHPFLTRQAGLLERVTAFVKTEMHLNATR